MSCSDSSPVNTTTTTTNARETNTNTSGNSGVTVAGSTNTSLGFDSHNVSNVNTTNISTDHGAVLAGTELGKMAIAANSGLSETIAGNAADFGSHALDVISKSQTESASLVSQYLAQGGSLLTQEEADLAGNFSQEQAGLASVYSMSTQQLGNFAATLGTIAQANDTSIASQSTAFATKALEIGAVVVLGVFAVIFISGAMRRVG